MKTIRKIPKIWLHTGLYVIFCIVLLLLTQFGHKMLPFNFGNYVFNTHRYVEISKLDGSFNLTKSLGVYDSNFYLFMADQMSERGGWHNNPNASMDSKDDLSSLAFAFAPLYPAVLAAVNLLFHNIALTAFIMAFLLGVAAFAAFYWLVDKYYGQKTAARAVWLMALAPPAVFLHLYFSEGLAILLMVFLLWTYREKKFIPMAIFTGLIVVTRFQMLILLPLLAFLLFKEFRRRRIGISKILLCGGLAILPMVIWTGLVWLWTGDPLYFIKIRGEWGGVPLTILASIVMLPVLPFHDFHLSMVDMAAIIMSGVVLLVSRRWLPKIWWWLALLVFIFPIITTDTMSGMRYQLVLLPLFIFMAAHLKKNWLCYLFPGLVLLQIFLMIAAVNYYWIG